MFTEHNTNGQYTTEQLEKMNARLLELYPLADDRENREFNEDLLKHYSDVVKSE